MHTASHEPVTFDRLDARYHADAPHSKTPVLDAIRCQSAFDEATDRIDRSTAAFETRRWLFYGNCFECDNRYGVCPETR